MLRRKKKMSNEADCSRSLSVSQGNTVSTAKPLTCAKCNQAMALSERTIWMGSFPYHPLCAGMTSGTEPTGAPAEPMPEKFHPSASHVEPGYRDGWNHATERMEKYCAGMARLADQLRAERDSLSSQLSEAQAQVQAMREALQYVQGGLALAYDAASKHLNDEVLLHCGHHEARIRCRPELKP